MADDAEQTRIPLQLPIFFQTEIFDPCFISNNEVAITENYWVFSGFSDFEPLADSNWTVRAKTAVLWKTSDDGRTHQTSQPYWEAAP